MESEESNHALDNLGDLEAVARLFDPIDQNLITHPVKAEDHALYNLDSISCWLKDMHISPVTGQEISSKLQEDEEALGKSARMQEQILKRSLQGDLHNFDSSVPSNLRTIRPRAVVAVEPLHDLLSEIAWKPPQIIVVGAESHGKSTIMERLLGLPLFPRAKKLCTRVPIRVQLRRGPTANPVIGTVEVNENILEGVPAEISELIEEEHQLRDKKVVSSAQMYEEMTKRMADLIKEHEEWQGISFTHEIVVKLQHPSHPELDLVDLPGIVVNARRGESADLPQRTLSLTKRYMEVHQEYSMFLVVQDVSGGDYAFRQSSVLNLVREMKIQERSLGVLTFCDKYLAKFDEEYDIPLKDLLTQSDCEDLAGFGWIHTGSDSKVKDKTLVVRWLKLEQKEQHTFKDQPFENWGIPQLVKAVVSSYDQFLTKFWIPKALIRLQKKFQDEKEKLIELGIPFSRDELPENLKVFEMEMDDIALNDDDDVDEDQFSTMISDYEDSARRRKSLIHNVSIQETDAAIVEYEQKSASMRTVIAQFNQKLIQKQRYLASLGVNSLASRIEEQTAELLANHIAVTREELQKWWSDGVAAGLKQACVKFGSGWTEMKYQDFKIEMIDQMSALHNSILEALNNLGSSLKVEKTFECSKMKPLVEDQSEFKVARFLNWIEFLQNRMQSLTDEWRQACGLVVDEAKGIHAQPNGELPQVFHSHLSRNAQSEYLYHTLSMSCFEVMISLTAAWRLPECQSSHVVDETSAQRREILNVMSNIFHAEKVLLGYASQLISSTAIKANIVGHSLQISNKRFSEQYAVDLSAELLRNDSALTELGFDKSEMNANILLVLTTALTASKIKTLIFQHCNIDGTNFKDFCVNALKTNLETLRLVKCGIPSECAIAIAKALESNDHLQELSLSGNILNADAGSALASMLRQNKTLKILFLDETDLPNESTPLIADSLKQNPSLEKLVLSQVELTDDVMTILAQALMGNSTLSHLDLSYCRISSDGLLSFFQGVDQCKLVLLGLTGNKIGDNQALAEAMTSFLQRNSSLQHVFLEWTMIPKSMMETISSAGLSCTLTFSSF